MKLRIASPVICDSIVDGPGLRMVIWTQGCKHNCKGCHNPQTHSLTKGYEVDTKEVIYKMASLKLQQGITLSGGEPFLQPAPLAEIAKQAKNMNLDVWSYTGFKFEELIDRRNPLYFENLELLKYVDVLVDGKFELLLPEDEQVFAYLRTDSDTQMLVCANFTGEPAECQISGEWKEAQILLHNYADDVPECGESLQLKPYEAFILLKQ